MKILDGVNLAEDILQGLKKNPLAKQLGLAVVQVGENAISKKYIAEKQKACEKIGISFELFEFPETILTEALKVKIREIGQNPLHSGMIIQLPLPKKFPTQEILDCIPQKKDVDVLSTRQFGLFALSKGAISPPTVHAISLLLKEAHISTLKGTNVAIVGSGRLVGLPLSLWLISQGATVSIVNKSTKDIGKITSAADILISGVGICNLIKGAMVKKGAVVIDAGSSVENGTSYGDVDFESASKKASFITKVPGGVGPLTVVCLLQNLLALQKRI